MTTSTIHVPWASIDNFHTVRASLVKFPELLGDEPCVCYRAKVKLHGTNAGIKITSNGRVFPMSREQVISVERDNAGFAKWVKEREEQFAALKVENMDVIVYGEWCGPGVQKGVGINKIPEKIFAVFAVRVINENQPDHLVVEPDTIKFIVKDNIPGLYVLPWYTQSCEVIIDWSPGADVVDLSNRIDHINTLVTKVEACDPWVQETFGVEGIGEGLVFYPRDTKVGYRNFSNLAFKAKGLAHQTVAKSKPVQADPIVASNAADFAELVVTEARMEQGVRLANDGELVFDMKKMGAYLKWISADVEKETKGELEASGLDARTATRACSDRARNWYIEQGKKL